MGDVRMGKKRKASRRVSTKSKDSWEISGNRVGYVRVVDLQTGETATVRFILDAGNNKFKVRCRRCGRWGTYSLNSITEDEKSSGLCPECFRTNNVSNLYAVGIDHEGNLVSINLRTGREEPWTLSDSKIENMKRLLFKGINLKLVKCPSDPFENAKKLLFVDDDSDYGKAIQNRKIEQYIAKIRAFERWKKTYPKELMELLSWPENQVSEKVFKQKFPYICSPTGRRITTPFLRAIREYCNYSKSKIVQDWEGFEFSVRDLISRWGQLDQRRYLIFDLGSNKFCYKEIDALAIGEKVNIVVDAKWSGGEVDRSQILLYMKFLGEFGIPVSRGIFVTADDEFDNLCEDVYRIPLEWFQLVKSIDKIDLFIQRLFKKES